MTVEKVRYAIGNRCKELSHQGIRNLDGRNNYLHAGFDDTHNLDLVFRNQLSEPDKDCRHQRHLAMILHPVAEITTRSAKKEA